VSTLIIYYTEQIRKQYIGPLLKSELDV